MTNATTGLVDHASVLRVPLAAPPPSVTARRYRKISLWLTVSDAAAICLALLVSYWIRFDMRLLPSRELVLLGLAPLVWVLVFKAFSLYRPVDLSPAEEFRRTVGATGVGVVLLVMVAFWSKSSFSRGWIGLTWAVALLVELLVRRFWRLYQHRRKLDGSLALRTLIIGSTGEAIRLAQALGAPGSGFVPLGYVQPHGAQEAGDTLPVLGGIDQLRELIVDQSVDCLFVASTLVESDALEVVSQAGRQQGVQVLVSANMTHVLSSRLALQQVGSVIALSLRPVRLSGTQAVAKRAFDLVLGSLALVATLPVWLAAAAAIRLTSPGPIFFHQERVTKGGRTFRMHKFRTMRQDPATEADTTVPFFKLDQDPRITRVGHLLRKWSLDELPQLWNVVQGEMSLVGPRPLPTEQVAANLELLGPRHEVSAGMTGWWQINGRSDVDPTQAVRLDAFYIENWSLAFDCYITLKTISTVMERKGAY
ncbi:MAG TPA: sugar transferase [Actinomycetota bacterium]|jgi:exopolysaccharide biosynthesis polyprenyl glycosylphosphotransferase|nr:sugar transferase [Actinomycetota bacterium]